MENQLLAIAASFSLLPLHRIIDGWDFKRLTWNTTYSVRSPAKLLLLKIIKYHFITTWITSSYVYYIRLGYNSWFICIVHYSLSSSPGSNFSNTHLQKGKLLIYWHVSTTCTCVPPSSPTEAHGRVNSVLKHVAIIRAYSQWKRAVWTWGKPVPLLDWLLLQVS